MVPDDLTQLLGETDVENGVIQMLSGDIVLEDLQRIARPQLFQEPIQLGNVIQCQRDGHLVRVLALVIEVQEGYVAVGGGGVVQELEQGASTMGQDHLELKETQLGQGRLQETDRLQLPFDGSIFHRIADDLEEDHIGVDAPIIMDAFYVPPVTLDDLGGGMQCPRLVRHASDEIELLGAHPGSDGQG